MERKVKLGHFIILVILVSSSIFIFLQYSIDNNIDEKETKTIQQNNKQDNESEQAKAENTLDKEIETEQINSIDPIRGVLTYEEYEKSVTEEYQNIPRDENGFITRPMPKVPSPENFKDRKSFEKAIQLYLKLFEDENKKVEEMLDKLVK